MGWLTTIIIGFVSGVLAKFLHPGRDNLGFSGSALAGFVGQKAGWYNVGEPAGWIASTVFAVIILAIYTRKFKKR